MGYFAAEKKVRHPLFSISITIVLLVSVALITYWGIGSLGRIPPFPAATISASASDAILSALKRRADTITPTAEERGIIEQLETIHLAETDERQGAPPNLRALLEDIEAELIERARADKERFLLLGDFLAARFHRTLAATFDGGNHPHLDVDLARFGGRFYARAKQRGLITASGRPTVSPALFNVLFRYRWRRFAGLDGDTGFTRDEQILLNDFFARFSEHDDPARRIAAVRQLKHLLPDYEDIVAEGLVRLQAGDRQGAIEVLERGIAGQHADPKARAFLNALTE